MKDGTENDPSLVYARMDEKGNFLPVEGSPASACSRLPETPKTDAAWAAKEGEQAITEWEARKRAVCAKLERDLAEATERLRRHNEALRAVWACWTQGESLIYASERVRAELFPDNAQPMGPGGALKEPKP